MSEQGLGSARERRSLSRQSQGSSKGGNDSKTVRSFVDHDLLTENKHHLRKGVNWKFDGAGAPHPFFPKERPKKIVTGVTSTCRCGATTGYGPDPAVSSDLAIRKCFNCRVLSVAALDPRGAQNKESQRDAIAKIHLEDIRKRKKGGCSCDGSIGRLWNYKTSRPYGWIQGHVGESRSRSSDWEGGVDRQEAKIRKEKALTWWERSVLREKITPKDQEGLYGGERYYPCRSFVYSPTRVLKSNTPDLTNADLPDARLELDFVYGYSAGCIVGAPSTEFGVLMGSDVQDNLRWLSDKVIVYFTAATGIVYDIESHTQRYFFGHDDAITCLALSPSRSLVATACKEIMRNTLDQLMTTYSRKTFQQNTRRSGRYLFSLAPPPFIPDHLFLWSSGNPCTSWGELKMADCTFVSHGPKHVGFWSHNGTEYVRTKVELEDNPLCVCFVKSPDALSTFMFTGQQSGSIIKWKDHVQSSTIKNAHPGGVTQIAWCAAGLLSGGVDCKLKVWKYKSGATLLKEPHVVVDLKVFAYSQHAWATSQVIPKSFDLLDDGTLLLGTSSSQIFVFQPPSTWEAEGDAAVDGGKYGKLVLDFHYRRTDNDSLQCVSSFPLQGTCHTTGRPNVLTVGLQMKHLFVTFGPDHSIRVWDTRARKLMQAKSLFHVRKTDQVSFPITPTSVDIAANCHLAAVGCSDGSWGVYLLNRKQEWVQIYITSKAQLNELRSELKSFEDQMFAIQNGQVDPYVMHHTNSLDILRANSIRLREEISRYEDFSKNVPVTTVKFAPNSSWLAVAGRDGSVSIFSCHDLKIAGPNGEWKRVCSFDLDGEVLDHFLLNADKAEPSFRNTFGTVNNKKLVPGEVELPGLQGRVKLLGSCKGHGSPITKMDWSVDCKVLKTCSEMLELLYWNMPRGTLGTRANDYRDLDWASTSSVCDWYLKGIWPTGCETSTVSAVDVSKGRGDVQVVVTGDKLGHVKLFRSPCCADKAKYRSYIGHASHVRNVMFSRDNDYVISLGGHDNSIFQWRYLPFFPDLLPTPETHKVLFDLVRIPSTYEMQKSHRFGKRLAAAVVQLQVKEGNLHTISYLFEHIREFLRLHPTSVSFKQLEDPSSYLLTIDDAARKWISSTPHRLAEQLVDNLRFPPIEVSRKFFSFGCVVHADLIEQDDLDSAIPQGDVVGSFVQPPGFNKRLYMLQASGTTFHACKNLRTAVDRIDPTKQKMVYIAGHAVVLLDLNKENAKQKIFSEHPDNVVCVAIHPDGNTIATTDCRKDPKIVIWDSESLTVRRELNVRGAIGSSSIQVVGSSKIVGPVEFERVQIDSEKSCNLIKFAVEDLMTSGIEIDSYIQVKDQILRVVDIDGEHLSCKTACLGTSSQLHKEGDEVRVYARGFRPRDTNGICCLTFSSHNYGDSIACVFSDDSNTVALLDAARGAIIAKEETFCSQILCIACHPKENIVVTCGVDHIRFWKPVGAKLAPMLPSFGELGRNQTFLCIGFCFVQYLLYGGETWAEGCPGGFVTLTGTVDGCVYMWESNQLVKTIFMAHDGPVLDLVVLDNVDSSILTVGSDQKVKVWNIVDWSSPPQVMLPEERQICQVDMSDLLRESPARLGQDSALVSVCVNEDSVLVGTSCGKIVQLFLEDSKLTGRYVVRTDSSTFVAGESAFVVCDSKSLGFVSCSASCHVKKWKINDHGDFFPLQWMESSWTLAEVTALELCSNTENSELLVIGHRDGKVAICDYQAFQLMHVMDEPAAGGVVLLRSSPDRKHLAVTFSLGVVHLYSLTTFSRVARISGDKQEVFGLEWSRDSAILFTNLVQGDKSVSVDGSHELELRDITSLHEVTTAGWSSPTGWASNGFRAADGLLAGVTCVQLSPSQTFLAVGDDFGRVTLTDFPCLTSSELRLSPFAAHHGPVSSLSFSHDGSLLLSSGLRDGCLLVWQVIDIPSDDFEPSPHLLRVLRKFESPYQVPPVPVEEQQDIFEQVPDYVVGLIKPADRTEAGALEGLHSLPHQKLQLLYVYNKRGYDSFQDVRVLNSGELVYFAAAIAVVHDISADGQLDRQRFFTRHRHEIGCLCVHPDGCMVATGDLHSTSSVYVWNADTLYYDLSERDYCSSTTIQLRSNTGGVVALSFCGDNNGNQLAAIGLDGYLYIYEWSIGLEVAKIQAEGEPRRHILSLTCDFKVSGQLVSSGINHIKFWTLVGRKIVSQPGKMGDQQGRLEVFLRTEFGPFAIAVSGTESGSIYMWKDALLLRVIPATRKAEIYDICFVSSSTGAASQILALTGGADGVCRVWEMRSQGEEIRMERLDEVDLKGLQQDRKGSVCITSILKFGSSIYLRTAENLLYSAELHESSPILGSLRLLYHGHTIGSIASMCANPRKLLFATASTSREVKVWDMEKKKSLSDLSLDCSPTIMDWHATDEEPLGIIAIGSSEGKVILLKLLEDFRLNKLQELSNKPEACVSAKFCPAGTDLVIGYVSGSIGFYRRPSGSEQFELAQSMNGHSGRVSAMDWTVENTPKFLRSNCFDLDELLFWQVEGANPRQVKRMKDVEKCLWHSDDCKVSWANQGLIKKITNSDYRPKYSITKVVASPCRNFILCGDQAGKCYMFRYPCLSERSLGNPIYGHMNCITGISFSFDSRTVLISSGEDNCVFQYLIIEKEWMKRKAEIDRQKQLREFDDKMTSASVAMANVKFYLKHNKLAQSVRQFKLAIRLYRECDVMDDQRTSLNSLGEELLTNIMSSLKERLSTIASTLDDFAIDIRGRPAIDDIEKGDKVAALLQECQSLFDTSSGPQASSLLGEFRARKEQFTDILLKFQQGSQLLREAQQTRAVFEHKTWELQEFLLDSSYSDSPPWKSIADSLVRSLDELQSILAEEEERARQSKDCFKGLDASRGLDVQRLLNFESVLAEHREEVQRLQLASASVAFLPAGPNEIVPQEKVGETLSELERLLDEFDKNLWAKQVVRLLVDILRGRQRRARGRFADDYDDDWSEPSFEDERREEDGDGDEGDVSMTRPEAGLREEEQREQDVSVDGGGGMQREAGRRNVRLDSSSGSEEFSEEVEDDVDDEDEE
ncbi:hypothetical protein GUITHDRAFT_107314 [Guillardia theta CCMP2712]|uniref:HELP domain-containing protein n=2 Tax=Guillardia theta TaxID=55529 RepID=L1JFP0_GUITC|nr:hypothetical protein GUITHDRAFT_107314 [Guillardia theta CCMP2712]EKX46964.1 hypothetical protein GUITHDRAFT_107314 [Guillardia theta CCMP2712]|eukprot:XP_005833944.1 hypothetical protein GUITHDRAFT_107314 [Guillardia theta CCMP2712]